jgi:3-dehydroquinate synthase class II
MFPYSGNNLLKTAFPVTSLKVGDEVLLRVQGGARHTGIEIQEFIVEK